MGLESLGEGEIEGIFSSDPNKIFLQNKYMNPVMI